MKYFAYILFTIIGVFISYRLYQIDSIWSVSIAFLTGCIGSAILNWED